MTHMSAPKLATTLYLKVEKMDTSTALPSRIRIGTQVIFSFREVNGAATDASADDKEIPASATFRAPQSLHPSPHIATRCLKHNNVNCNFYFLTFFFYIKRALAKGKQKHVKKIPLVARPCKEDSRRNKSKSWSFS